MVMCCCPVGGGILFPVFSQARVAAQSTQSMSKIKNLAIAWNMYSGDSDDRACPFPDWNNSLRKYAIPLNEGPASDPLIDPLLTQKSNQLGFGMNREVALKEAITFEDPAKVVVLAITDTPGKDAAVTKETLRKASQGPFRTIWATADGAVKKALIDEAQRLHWKPVLMKQ
jgi:hypothetical protein